MLANPAHVAKNLTEHRVILRPFFSSMTTQSPFARSRKVRGIIITGAASDRIKYALYASDGIAFFNYKLNFDLVEVEKVS